MSDFKVKIHQIRFPLGLRLRPTVPPHHSSRKRVKQSKKRKKSRFLDFQKNVKKRSKTLQ